MKSDLTSTIAWIRSLCSNPAMTTVRGLRIHLRPPAVTDLREFVAAARASRQLHGGWVTPPLTAVSFRAYLDRMKHDDFRAFLVCRNDSAELRVLSMSGKLFVALSRARIWAFMHWRGTKRKG